MSLSPYSRDLLRKAASEVPPAERRELAKKRFAQATLAAGMGAVAGKSLSASPKLLLLAKVVGVLVVGAGAAALVLPRREPPRPPVETLPIVEAPAPVVAPVLGTPVEALPSVVVPPPPPSSATATATATTTSTPRALEPKPLDPLVYEASLLEKARACLASADAACARARLNEHERLEHPHLRDEAAVLDVDVLRKEGRADDARSAASRFLEQRPSSPYAKRMRAIAEGE